MIQLVRSNILSLPFAIVISLLSIILAWRFQISLQFAAALLLTGALITLALIDFQYFYLPDVITLPFLWIGLLLSLKPVFQTSESCILGAVGGYLSLWTIYQLFKYLRGKEGLGHGDFKLLSMLGAWLGIEAVPLILFIASLLGSVIGLSLILLQKKQKDNPIPFGPYLAIGGFIALLWQENWIHFYLSFLV